MRPRSFPALRLPALLLLPSALLLGCSPAFNWREVRLPPTRLQALMPCKPDEATRSVPLDGRSTPMHLAGCDAGGATFVLGWTAVDVPGRVGATLGAWQDATLAQAGIAAGPDAPAGVAFVPPGGTALPQSRRIAGTGRRPDGSALAFQGAWFATTGEGAPHAMFAAVYGMPASPDAIDTFLAGLRLP